MAFQIKDMASITLSIINFAKAVQSKITDFSIGSAARTMFEAPAAEIEELYQQMFIGLKESIPVAIYNGFDFSRQQAKASTGMVRIAVTPSASIIVIPAGSIFSPSGYGVTFESTSDVSIPPGQTVADLYIYATAPGAIGNVVQGVSFSLSPGIGDVVSIVALASFTSGTDEETDSQRKARFISYIQTLNRGTEAALRYGLSTVEVKDALGNVTERVAYKKVIEPYKNDANAPISLVNCYIHNGSSGASTDLINAAKKTLDGYKDAFGNRIPGWKAAGVKVTVEAATNIPVNVSGTATIDPLYSTAAVIASIDTAVIDYISQLDIGANVIVAEIIAAVMGVDGVTNYAPTLPAADVVVSSTQKAVVGVVTIGAA